MLLGGFSLSNQEKSNRYVDTSSKRGVCDKCGKMAEVAVQMTATAKAVDQQAKAASGRFVSCIDPEQYTLS